MEHNICKRCSVVANSLSMSCPNCGVRFYPVNDKQRILGIATLLSIAIAAGFFTIFQTVPAIVS